MSLVHSPKITRSQALSRAMIDGEQQSTPLRTTNSEETSDWTDALQEALEQIRELREERSQQQAQFVTMLQQRDEELRRLQERLVTWENNQLSPLHNRIPNNTTRRNSKLNNVIHNNFELGYKLKPENFDGSVSLREFIAQFDLIARANGWNSFQKTLAFAACLRGKARTVLDGISEIENLEFTDLKSKFEFHFGEEHSAQSYYTQFTNRRQKSSEDLASLGADLERLSRLAYPECSHEVRDKIACAQFITAISDGFLKRTLQLESITSLKSAIQRAMAIIVPRNFINQVLEEAHDSASDGHFGVNKTLEKIRKRFYWATCKNDVEDWCRSCKVCVARRGPSGKGKSPLQVFDAGFPFERIQMDILGPLPTTTAGNRYLLVIIDCFTKWEVTRLLGIRKTRTTALHPQSNGQVERHHQTILNYLAKFVSENQKDWDD
ncbi:uncharacterized protein LOC114946194 [Nylanderia fulva]|uniref:uncharacterized protein LOC114946194 n=1 Tax=Nylanderia fulva TaxID=613905 RepID=UPI0010FB45AE|nr:uncharacterized protein LOC114946194 [Nylanderia fulva]